MISLRVHFDDITLLSGIFADFTFVLAEKTDCAEEAKIKFAVVRTSQSISPEHNCWS